MFPFRELVRFGLGGKMGKGNQMFSWIHEKDFANAVQFILENESLIGPVNIAAPMPLTNEEFMRTLRKESKVLFGLPLSKFMLEIGAILIQTETELILKSRWVIPDKLLQSGFVFQFPDMQSALKNLLSSSYAQFGQLPLKSQ
jgi:NAD dependent epimerase/dehydratase family enzyme